MIRREFKRYSESENNIHDGRKNIMNLSNLEENGTQPLKIGTISKQTMKENHFGSENA